MAFNQLLLTVAGILPALILCLYVFKKDRAEKEPVRLLMFLLGLGVIICLPAAFAEQFLTIIINLIFMPFFTEVDGTMVIENPVILRIYTAVEYFLNVALVEEGLKFLALYTATRKNKNFNSFFDGLIYSVFVSLGFAGFENIFYVTQYGWMNALMRAVMSVPAHMFFSVFMGYYYSMWHVKIKACQLERHLKMSGIIPHYAKEYTYGKDTVMCLLIPVLAHGLYDYCCSVDSLIEEIIFFGFLIFMYFFCFRKIRIMSKTDMDDHRYASALVAMKHPEYLNLLRENKARLNEERLRQQTVVYTQSPHFPAASQNENTGY